MEVKFMKWVVDRFEEDLVILVNDKTSEVKELDKSSLPSSIHEGSILNYVDNKYVIDSKEEEERRKSIKDRFNKLKKK